jgi:hypothetical protein
MTTGPTRSAIPPYRNVSTAPFVYFDFVAAYGVANGVIEIELTARCLIPGEEAPTTESVPVARLRCSTTAIRSLEYTITKVMELLKDAQKRGGPPILSATGKLN